MRYLKPGLLGHSFKLRDVIMMDPFLDDNASASVGPSIPQLTGSAKGKTSGISMFTARVLSSVLCESGGKTEMC